MPRRPVNLPYTITTEFGVPDSYAKFGRHSGTDYGVPKLRAIYAPKSGQLTNVVSPTGGNMVTIDDGQFTHRLMHNDSFARMNGSVQEGDVVAYADSTGLSTGNHCHWDISAQGVYPSSFAGFRDPWQWLQGAYNPPKPAPAPALLPTQRKLNNPTGVNQRTAPSTSAQIIKEWPLDSDPIFNFKGYVRGGDVNGNNIWFVGASSGGYFSSVAFEGGANTAGLTDLTPSTSNPTPPTPIPTPPADTYPSFTKDVACVTEVKPAYYKDKDSSNYEKGNFPAKPTGVVLHDFGTDGVNTFESTVNYFRKPGIEISAHFVVSGKKIVQMVSLSDRAWHAGPLGNDKIGIEVDPDVDTNIDTKNSVLDLLKELDARNGVLTRYLHSQFMATACGDDIQKANLLIPPQAPTLPNDSELEKRVAVLENIVKYIQDFLASIFSGFKKK